MCKNMVSIWFLSSIGNLCTFLLPVLEPVDLAYISVHVSETKVVIGRLWGCTLALCMIV